MRTQSLGCLSTSPQLRLKRRTNRSFANKSPIDRAAFIMPKVQKRIIDKLRDRRKKRIDKVDPALASIVIKKFILPLFFQESQHKLSRSRSTLYNNNLLIPIKPPNKLSDQILEMIELSEVHLKALYHKLEKTKKMTENAKVKLAVMKLKTNESETVMNTIDTSVVTFNSAIKKQKLILTFNHNEKLSLQSKSKEKFKSRDKLVTQLETLKAQSQTLDSSSQLYFIHQNIIGMRSAIIGEKLKGFYDACINTFSPIIFEDKLKRIISLSYEKTSNLIIKENLRMNYADIEVTNVVHFIEGSTKSYQKWKKIVSDVKRLKSALLSTIQNLTINLQNTESENENLLSSKTFIESKINGFSSEYWKLKERLGENSVHRTNESETEMICETCGKNFFEKENFSWSCRVHLGAWSGSMYWCCGKKTKHSLGCDAQKHLSKREIPEIEGKPKPSPIIFCTSCRKRGHSTHFCESDPNLKPSSSNRSLSVNKIDKILEVYKKQRKTYKQLKKTESISHLKETLNLKNKTIRRKKLQNPPKNIPEAPTTPSLENSLLDYFPSLSKRRLSQK